MLVSFPHGAAIYSATSLEDIAAHFEFLGRCAVHNASARTQRAKLLGERERATWQRAADMLRSTTLQPE